MLKFGGPKIPKHVYILTVPHEPSKIGLHDEQGLQVDAFLQELIQVKRELLCLTKTSSEHYLGNLVYGSARVLKFEHNIRQLLAFAYVDQGSGVAHLLFEIVCVAL